MPPAAATTKLAAQSHLSPNSPSHEHRHPISVQARAQAQALARLAQEGSCILMCCEPSADGVLTAVGLSYLAHLDPARVRLMRQDLCQPTLLESSFYVTSDVDLAQRVLKGFEEACGKHCPKSRERGCNGCSDQNLCVRRIAYASASDDPAMPEVVHRYLRMGFEHGQALRNLGAHPHVSPLLDMAHAVSNECERARQFVRFSRMKDGTFLAQYRPHANVIPFVAGYFQSRMGNERWCLLDPVHRVAAMSAGELVVTYLDDELMGLALSNTSLASDEHYVRALWKLFYDRISLPGRSAEERGYDLRLQLMPHRVRDCMPEFDPRNDNPGPAPERYRASAAAAALPSV